MSHPTKSLALMLERAGLSQAEACRKTGINVSDMSRFVNGKRKVSGPAARALSDLLDVSPETLGWRPNELPPPGVAELKHAKARVQAIQREVTALARAAYEVADALEGAEVALVKARRAMRAALSPMPQDPEET